MVGSFPLKVVPRLKVTIGGTLFASLKVSTMAAFKKFDPYAFLENRRRLAAENLGRYPKTIELSQVSRLSRGCHLEIEKTDCKKPAEESPTSYVENEKSTGTPAKAAKAAKAEPESITSIE